MNRGDRLQHRFDLIQKTLAELHGRELAFAASSAAHLRAIQYGAEASMKAIGDWATQDGSRKGFNSSAREYSDSMIARYDAEHQAMLQGFHERLCAHLGVDPARALELSKAFEQVVRDICLQGG